MSCRLEYLKKQKLSLGRIYHSIDIPEGRIVMTGLDFDFRRYNYKNTNRIVKLFGHREKIAKTRQKHTKNIVYYPNPGEYVGVDGFITKNRAVMIVTADCIPIVIRGGGEVALLHAGWRGVKKRIYLDAIVHFKKKEIEDLECFMLPSISREDFEVGEDFLEEFRGRQHFEKFLQKKENGRYTFDLKALVKSDMRDLGVKNINIETHSTLNSKLFHSYRREGANYGLNAIIFFPKEVES